MKILRSQYLKLQCNNSKVLQGFSDNKLISNKGKENIIGKNEVEMTVVPTRLPGRNDTNCNSSPKSIKIFIENTDKTLQKLNVVLEYIDMSTSWYTNMYKTYENDLWRKKFILDINCKKYRVFNCGLCANVYKNFYSMKCHLNKHLNLFPHVCKICLKKYTGRKSATRHLKTSHQVGKKQWNDFLTS